MYNTLLINKSKGRIGLESSLLTPFNSECASLDKNAGSLILSFTIFCCIFCLFPLENGGCKNIKKKKNKKKGKKLGKFDEG